MEPFLVPRQTWNAAIKSSMSANVQNSLISIGDKAAHSRVLLIARCEVTENGEPKLQNIGLIVTSNEWIPVQSSYELKVAHKLVLEKHWFSKPMRVKHGCPYVPDFVRHGANGDTPMEVAGMMDDPEYAADLTDKLANYPLYFSNPCWVWYAKPDTDVPSI